MKYCILFLQFRLYGVLKGQNVRERKRERENTQALFYSMKWKSKGNQGMF